MEHTKKPNGRPRKPFMVYYGVRVHKRVAEVLSGEAKRRKMPVGTLLQTALETYLGRSVFEEEQV